MLHYHLGSNTKHTVYKAEGVGVAMALHLPKLRNRQLTHCTTICLDSQALLLALDNQCPQFMILPKIHMPSKMGCLIEWNNMKRSQIGLPVKVERVELLTFNFTGCWSIVTMQGTIEQTKKLKRLHKDYPAMLNASLLSYINPYQQAFQPCDRITFSQFRKCGSGAGSDLPATSYTEQ